jgi:MFS family permease
MTGKDSKASPPGDDQTGIFSVRAFRLLFVTRVGSMMSYQMLGTVVGWQIYDITQSAMALGLVGLIQLTPSFCFALLSGEIADRFDRRVVVRWAYITQSTVTLGFLLVSLIPHPPITVFYCLLFVNATARTFEGPSLQSLLPSLVPTSMLGRAIAVYSSATRLATMFGPSVGGVIYAFGVDTDYACCLVLVGISLMASFRLPPPAVKNIRKGARMTWGSMSAGLKYIWNNQLLFSAMSLDLLATFFGGVTALLPIFARDILEIGPWGLGILRSSPSVGALIMAIILARFPVTRSAGYVILGGAAVYGLASILFGISHNAVMSIIFLFFFGAGDTISQVNRKTLMQVMTPPEVLGRVTAVNSFSTTMGNQLGQFESGMTAAWFGAQGSVIFGGLSVLTIVAIWAWRYPQLRRVERADAVGMIPGPA